MTQATSSVFRFVRGLIGVLALMVLGVACERNDASLGGPHPEPPAPDEPAAVDAGATAGESDAEPGRAGEQAGAGTPDTGEPVPSDAPAQPTAGAGDDDEGTGRAQDASVFGDDDAGADDGGM